MIQTREMDDTTRTALKLDSIRLERSVRFKDIHMEGNSCSRIKRRTLKLKIVGGSDIDPMGQQRFPDLVQEQIGCGTTEKVIRRFQITRDKTWFYQLRRGLAE